MIKTFCILSALGLFLAVSAPSVIAAAAGRGHNPQCQEQCLAKHIRAMQKLSDDLARTGTTLTYQDLVDHEVSDYLDCVTNCRIINPVK